MKKVFISYSTKETDSALRVKASLEKKRNFLLDGARIHS